MGLVKPQTGTILLNQMPIQQALKQNLVSYVPQSEEVDWQFPVSVYDVVMMGRYGYMGLLRRPSSLDKQKVMQAMERVDICHLQHRQIGELSGGQKKRVFWLEHWRKKVRLFYWTSRLPVLMSKPKMPSLNCCSNCVAKDI
ncbi:iron (chelated) transporter, ATP-binding protein [Actinobacillus equuli]|nr:iron (chelated) transporter, ATP-binding protein [Actinobacillus equuli]